MNTIKKLICRFVCWKLGSHFQEVWFPCPVCKYPYLHDNPADENQEICPQCKVQFGYHGGTYAELREAWIERGSRFESQNAELYSRRDKWLQWAGV